MSLPGGTGFSGKQFWGIQLKAQPNNSREKQVRVNSNTELHISNAIVEFGFLNKPHKANCSFSIGVRYETDRCDCEIRESLINPGRNYCSLHQQQQQSCVICIIKPEAESEADLDINFVGGKGKDLTFYYSSYCDCGNDYSNYHSINITGYVVSG